MRMKRYPIYSGKGLSMENHLQIAQSVKLPICDTQMLLRLLRRMLAVVALAAATATARPADTVKNLRSV